MKPSQGLEFVQYINFVAEVMPDNKHTPENTNNLKAIIASFCESTKIPKPQAYLQVWCASDDGDGQCENIEIFFGDRSMVKFEDDTVQLFDTQVTKQIA
ncbi:hypothetical protein ACXJY6_18720 [Vibrio sp. RC27]